MKSSLLAMAILKIDHQIFNLRVGFHLIGSDKTLGIFIDSKTIDEKHALLEISSNGMKIFDLQTKNGTFIDGNKIECVKSIELPKKCLIQFGSLAGNITLINENDSGFLEKLISIDISSPEHTPQNNTFSLQSKRKQKNTSTPNNISLKSEVSSPSTTDNNEKLTKNNFTNSNSTNFNIDEDKSSFFVPETQSVFSSINKDVQSNKSNLNFNGSIKENQRNNISSFCVPETQQFNTPNKSTADISWKFFNKKSKENVDKDEFFIPETQEVFKEEHKLQIPNSQISLYKISTQEFNATAFACGSVLDNSCDLSNDSENLLNGIDLPEILNKSTIKSEKATNFNNNNFDVNGEDDFDAEMSALKWIETNKSDDKSFNLTVRNSITEQIRNDAITPDIVFENNSPIIDRNDSVTPDLIFDDLITENEKDKLESSFKENENNMEPTQKFIKPVEKIFNNKSVKLCDDYLEATQLFSKPLPLRLESDKQNQVDLKTKNNIDKNKSVSTTNQQLFDIDHYNSLEPTQPFIREKTNNLPEKDTFLKFSLESDDEEMSPIKRNITIIKNKLMSSSDDEEYDKFKEPVNVKKINSNSSNKKHSISSTGSNKSTNKNSNDSQNSFNFITCTPKFEFIKPHHSNDIKQATNLFTSVKSKNTKLLLEESSDDDSQDIEKLLNKLDERDIKSHNKSKNVKKSSNTLGTDKSKKSKSVIIESEKSTSKLNIKYQDAVDPIIRKSKRQKNLPSYITDNYIRHNFTEEELINDYESTKRATRKRSHKTEEENDDEYSTKTRKTSNQKRGRKKNTNKEKVEKIKKPNKILSKPTGNDRVMRSQNKTLNHKFVFTIIDASKYRKMIESMGGEIVDDPKDAAILITNRIIRTCKFMVALARGIPIVSDKWLDTIKDNPDNSKSYKEFFIKDPDNEKKFNFSLTKTLKLSSKDCIFKDFTFLITPKTTPPPAEIIQMVTCSGAQYVKEIPKGSIDISKFYVVSDIKDKYLWPKIKKIIPNVNIINTEGILLSIIQHKLRFSDNLLGKK